MIFVLLVLIAVVYVVCDICGKKFGIPEEGKSLSSVTFFGMCGYTAIGSIAPAIAALWFPSVCNIICALAMLSFFIYVYIRERKDRSHRYHLAHPVVHHGHGHTHGHDDVDEKLTDKEVCSFAGLGIMGIVTVIFIFYEMMKYWWHNY